MPTFLPKTYKTLCDLEPEGADWKKRFQCLCPVALDFRNEAWNTEIPLHRDFLTFPLTIAHHTLFSYLECLYSAALSPTVSSGSALRYFYFIRSSVRFIVLRLHSCTCTVAFVLYPAQLGDTNKFAKTRQRGTSICTVNNSTFDVLEEEQENGIPRFKGDRGGTIWVLCASTAVPSDNSQFQELFQLLPLCHPAAEHPAAVWRGACVVGLWAADCARSQKFVGFPVEWLASLQELEGAITLWDVHWVCARISLLHIWYPPSLGKFWSHIGKKKCLVTGKPASVVEFFSTH